MVRKAPQVLWAVSLIAGDAHAGAHDNAEQTEHLHQSMGMVREAPPIVVNPPALVSDSEGERDFSDQLLETWMLLEYCDQGNLESAAREARFKNDFVSACCPYCHCLYYMHADVNENNFAASVTRRSPAQLK